MKARLVPLTFEGKDADFDSQLDNLKRLLVDEVAFLDPVPLGGPLPPADAVIFPQLLGEAFRRVDEFKAIEVPIIVATSEFGMLNMWDWEIVSYLRTEGVEVIAPYKLAQTKKVCKGLAVKHQLRDTKFLVFQDKPGEGMQGEIFKRFYWFEDECIGRMQDKFGFSLVKRSFKEFGAAAKRIPDAEADAVIAEKKIPTGGISDNQLRSAVKIYLGLKRELAGEETVGAVGINCLNESFYSDTTPCLAWNLLYEEDQMIWGCEADIVSMMTKYILHKSLDVPIMMTNIYPFLMGQAALKHERIPAFPEVAADADDHILVAHCGYLGVVPQSFSTEWTLRSKVLAIVDDNATAIDARLPEGPITLAKLHPTMQKWTVAEGALTGYAQYPDSDCLTGGVIKIADGQKLLKTVSSHHYLLMTGHNLADIELLSAVFGLEVEVI
ncbi:MAG: hypothetical protein PVH18_03200 [Chloroflexota bacterium]|jgi:hypothetical protein